MAGVDRVQRVAEFASTGPERAVGSIEDATASTLTAVPVWVSAPDTGHQVEGASENVIAGAARPRASWDISKIPTFARDQPNRPGTPIPVAARPLPNNIQRKLAIGRTDDPLEHEADRVADQVMRMPDPALSSGAAPLQISRKCAVCEEEDADNKKLQMKPAAASQPQTGQAPDIVHDVLQTQGQPLDAASRTYFEPRFGHDFSGVRVHTDGRAAESAVSIGACAYTGGSNIAFAAGRYDPATSSGRRLLAHELTHVVQQRAAHPSGAYSGAPFTQRDADSDLQRRACEGACSCGGACADEASGTESAATVQTFPLQRQEELEKLDDQADAVDAGPVGEAPDAGSADAAAASVHADAGADPTSVLGGGTESAAAGVRDVADAGVNPDPDDPCGRFKTRLECQKWLCKPWAGTCIWAGPTSGGYCKCSWKPKEPNPVPSPVPKPDWEKVKAQIRAALPWVVAAALIVLLAACFATGWCEVGMIVAAVGAAAAAIVVGILRSAGVDTPGD